MTPEDPLCEIVVTAPDADWLAAFARRLVEEGLAAAAHLHPIRSVYRWRGIVHDEAEARVSLHTRVALVPRIRALVTAEHPYEVPGFFVLAALPGSDPYDSWIRAETTGPVGSLRPSGVAEPGHPPGGPDVAER
jgi:periplasmic divalent cation tolerance protein